MGSLIIRNARIVGPRHVTDGDISVEGGRIAEIGKLQPSAGTETVDASGMLALPGFVDIHTHGGLGFDATNGVFNPADSSFDSSSAAYERALPRLMQHHARHGVTRCLLGTLAAPMEDLERSLGALAAYVRSESNGAHGTRLEGAFLEGTFVMRKENAGAQNPANFRRPDPALFDQLNRAARGAIRYVNVAPEYGDPATQLTEYLTKKKVLVGAGHSACAADQVARCAQAGLKVAIHFLNGRTGFSYKPFYGGNVMETFLRGRGLSVEIIGDGVHVAPAYVMDVIRRKGADKVVAVTDAIFPAGAEGIREFSLSGIAGKVHPSGQYVHVAADAMVLYGSVLNMATAFGNFMSWLTGGMEGVWYAKHAALPSEAALVKVARMCATNPARLVGLGRRTGSLQTGRCADITLASLEGQPGRYELKVRQTYLEGRRIA